MFTFKNPNYPGRTIHFGGQAFGVNDGVVTMNDTDASIYGARLVAEGFRAVEDNDAAATILPKKSAKADA